MKIRMLLTQFGSEDGNVVKQFAGGQVYEMESEGAQELAAVFLREKYAVEHVEKRKARAADKEGDDKSENPTK